MRNITDKKRHGLVWYKEQRASLIELQRTHDGYAVGLYCVTLVTNTLTHLNYTDSNT
jgi:hypothetical protein